MLAIYTYWPILRRSQAKSKPFSLDTEGGSSVIFSHQATDLHMRAEGCL